MDKKILIVDDEPDIAKVLLVKLKEQEFEASVEFSAPKALIHVKENKPDLIILDIMMPEMSGAEFAQELARSTDTKDIPIIFLSALLSKQEEKERGGVMNENIIFAKPYDIKKLIDKINQVLA